MLLLPLFLFYMLLQMNIRHNAHHITHAANTHTRKTINIIRIYCQNEEDFIKTSTTSKNVPDLAIALDCSHNSQVIAIYWYISLIYSSPFLSIDDGIVVWCLYIMYSKRKCAYRYLVFRLKRAKKNARTEQQQQQATNAHRKRKTLQLATLISYAPYT